MRDPRPPLLARRRRQLRLTLKALLADPGAGGQGDLQQPATGRVFHWVAQPTRDGAAAARSA